MASVRPQFKHRDVDGAACLAAFVIGALAFWVGVKPALHTEEDTHRLDTQMRESKVQLESTQDQYREVRQAIASAGAELAELAIVLDAPDQLAFRQAEISRVFQEAGLSLDQLTVGSIRQGELLGVIPFHLSGSGSFPDVVAIMHTVQERFPDMAITAFQLAAAGSAEDRHVGFSFGIEWYVVRNGGGRG